MAPRRRKVTVGVDFSGPWFQHDPVKTYRENVQRMLEEMAAFGERDVKARIAAIGPNGVRTGHTRMMVKGRVRSIAGKHWKATAVVSPYTGGLSAKEATSLLAAASYIEGRFHPFRRAATDQRKFKKELESELIKGLD